MQIPNYKGIINSISQICWISMLNYLLISEKTFKTIERLNHGVIRSDVGAGKYSLCFCVIRNEYSMQPQDITQIEKFS